MREFLTSTETKKQLTVFLSKKDVTALSERLILFLTVYHTSCETKTPDLDLALANNYSEEASTIIDLYVIDVTHQSLFLSLLYLFFLRH